MEEGSIEHIPIIERVEIGRCKFAIRRIEIFWSAQVTDCPHRADQIAGICIARESREELQLGMEDWATELENERLCNAYSAGYDRCVSNEPVAW